MGKISSLLRPVCLCLNQMAALHTEQPTAPAAVSSCLGCYHLCRRRDRELRTSLSLSRHHACCGEHVRETAANNILFCHVFLARIVTRSITQLLGGWGCGLRRSTGNDTRMPCVCFEAPFVFLPCFGCAICSEWRGGGDECLVQARNARIIKHNCSRLFACTKGATLGVRIPFRKPTTATGLCMFCLISVSDLKAVASAK